MIKLAIKNASSDAVKSSNFFSGGVDYTYWWGVFLGLCLIAAFNNSSMAVATAVASVFFIFLAKSMMQKMPRALGYILIASCYERPVLDFGIGIRGTIKLVDIAIVALVLVTLWRQLSGKSLKVTNTSLVYLVIITAIAANSSLLITLFTNYPFDDTRKSVYYAVILIEYCLALWAMQKIIFSEQDIKKYFSIFLYGLTIVAIIGILQGLGLVENEYYASANAASIINKAWAISVLAPNHTHLGTYMALAVVLSVLFLHQRFQFRYIVIIVLCMAALAFSHSAVGFGMIALYVGFLSLKGGRRIKLIAFVMGGVGILFVALYMGGIAGDDADRTAKKYNVTGGDSEVLLRSIVYPVELLTIAVKEFPAGAFFGFGFKVSHLIAPMLPSTGDNNYFSVLMDVGLIGFVLYLAFLRDLYRRTKLSALRAAEGFNKFFTFHMHVWLKVTLVAMFVQEILWPLHSRGSTMIIFLIIIEVSAMLENKKKEADTNKRFKSQDNIPDKQENKIKPVTGGVTLR